MLLLYRRNHFYLTLYADKHFGFSNVHCRYLQLVTRHRNKKQPKFFKSGPKKEPRQFLLQYYAFHCSPKCYNNFLLFLKNICHQNFSEIAQSGHTGFTTSDSFYSFINALTSCFNFPFSFPQSDVFLFYAWNCLSTSFTHSLEVQTLLFITMFILIPGAGPIKKSLRRFQSTQFFKHSYWLKNMINQSKWLNYSRSLNFTL